MATQIALPPTLPPRLIGRSAAAAYLSVSPTTFDGLVEKGTMPRAKRLGERRKAWDVKALDAAIDQLPDDGEQVLADDTSWNDVDATQTAAPR
jgi:predicted DNA-binding transcriptional regulator AlpA